MSTIAKKELKIDKVKLKKYTLKYVVSLVIIPIGSRFSNEFTIYLMELNLVIRLILELLLLM